MHAPQYLAGRHVTYRLLAGTVVLTHLAVVVLGGLLVLRWRRVVWVPVPAVMWGVILEVVDLGCPLTPVENWLRAKAGETGYAGGLIDHYLLPVLYPAPLTRTVQFALGGFALVVNVLISWWLVGPRARSAPARGASPRHCPHAARSPGPSAIREGERDGGAFALGLSCAFRRRLLQPPHG